MTIYFYSVFSLVSPRLQFSSLLVPRFICYSHSLASPRTGRCPRVTLCFLWGCHRLLYFWATFSSGIMGDFSSFQKPWLPTASEFACVLGNLAFKPWICHPSPLWSLEGHLISSQPHPAVTLCSCQAEAEPLSPPGKMPGGHQLTPTRFSHLRRFSPSSSVAHEHFRCLQKYDFAIWPFSF